MCIRDRFVSAGWLVRRAVRIRERWIETLIERYSTPEMVAVWTEEAKMTTWLEVELAVCEAWAELGEVPDEALADIREKAAFDVERVNEIEETTHHDVIAFLTNVAEHVGDASKYSHFGMTSSDMLDTALAVQLRRAGGILAEETRILGRVLQQRALEHRDTVMIGRSHGVHAEPITFGMVLGLWAFEVHRGLERLERATEQVAVGKISGAVGTYANIDPRVEEMATDVLEAEEYFSPGQKGSSAMPHKRNPIISERLSGQARVIRGNLTAALENIPLWHERDISHSSVERIILPDSTILLHYMLRKAVWLVDRLVVYPENMAENMGKSHGLVFSQRVLLELVRSGLLREEAYRLVQRNAMHAWEEGEPFQEVLAGDEEVAGHLTAEQLDDCFDPSYHLRHLPIIFERIEGLSW